MKLRRPCGDRTKPVPIVIGKSIWLMSELYALSLPLSLARARVCVCVCVCECVCVCVCRTVNVVPTTNHMLHTVYLYKLCTLYFLSKYMHNITITI